MDSRFTLKLTFSIYGKEYPWDCSLNWSAEPGEIDRRITDFFLNAHDEALAELAQETIITQAKRDQEETEARERAELQRLREKYRDGSTHGSASWWYAGWKRKYRAIFDEYEATGITDSIKSQEPKVFHRLYRAGGNLNTEVSDTLRRRCGAMLASDLFS